MFTNKPTLVCLELRRRFSDSFSEFFSNYVTNDIMQDVPLYFVKKHNIQLQPHVKLQGSQEESPFQTVTCTYNMLQDSEERSTRPPLSLGWGDFVRDNALQVGQQLVFTLVSESFFVIREVSEIVIYTK